jgi:hypothetical protein
LRDIDFACGKGLMASTFADTKGNFVRKNPQPQVFKKTG